jgi:hypothetical protein
MVINKKYCVNDDETELHILFTRLFAFVQNMSHVLRINRKLIKPKNMIRHKR